MRAILVALLAVLLCVPGAAGQLEGPRDPIRLSVLTYNLRYDNPGDGEDRWEKRREQVFALIRDHDPDVIGVQEALRNQLDDLAKALPGYGEVGVGRDDGKTAGEYSAILYRKERFRVVDSGTFWLSETPDVAGSKSWGSACVRICTWALLSEKESGRALTMFNTHLDHQSQKAREEGVKVIGRRVASRMAQEWPALITGDFNAGEENPAIGPVKDQASLNNPGSCFIYALGMRDSFRMLHPDEPEAGTFNNFGKPGGTRDKIDYIFVPGDTVVKEAGIDRRRPGGRYPSDHFAVWARVDVPIHPN